MPGVKGPRTYYSRHVAIKMLDSANKQMHYSEIVRTLQPIIKPEQALRVYVNKCLQPYKRDQRRLERGDDFQEHRSHPRNHPMETKIEIGLKGLAYHVVYHLSKPGYIEEVSQGVYRLTSSGVIYARYWKTRETITPR